MVIVIFWKGNKLFLSSYDCILCLWDFCKGKIELVVIVISFGWIYIFCFYLDGIFVFMGDE